MQNPAEFLIPRPSPVKLIRIGGNGDGAYLIPDDLEGIEACFSPGVNNFKHFEDELANKHGIKCHMCDFSSDSERFSTPLIEGMQTFKKKWLDTDDGPDSVSLQEWIYELSPDPSKDLILQIDIEGAEYRNLLAADNETLLRFRIIVVELHQLGAFRSSDLLSKQVQPLLFKLSDAHTCVHAHPNNCCGDFIDLQTGLNISNVMELTYLRRDRFRGDESQFIRPQLPHPLDIPRNVKPKPPIHLNQNWLYNNTRTIESEIKVLEDNLSYANWRKDNPVSANRLRKRLLPHTSADSADLNKIHRLSIVNLFQSFSGLSCQDSIESRLFLQSDEDLALGKQFFLSKAYRSYPLDGIVVKDSRFFFHTAIDTNQSITIDLGRASDLNYLIITNRSDACQDRARELFCIVHDEREYSVRDVLPVAVTDDFLKPNGPPSITLLTGKKGRYLTIFSPVYTALHFSSVRLQ